MTSLPILVGLTSVHYYSRAINFLLDNSKYSHCSIVLNEGQASLTVDCNILKVESPYLVLLKPAIKLSCLINLN